MVYGFLFGGVRGRYWETGHSVDQWLGLLILILVLTRCPAPEPSTPRVLSTPGVGLRLIEVRQKDQIPLAARHALPSVDALGGVVGRTEQADDDGDAELSRAGRPVAAVFLARGRSCCEVVGAVFFVFPRLSVDVFGVPLHRWRIVRNVALDERDFVEAYVVEPRHLLDGDLTVELAFKDYVGHDGLRGNVVEIGDAARAEGILEVVDEQAEYCAPDPADMHGRARAMDLGELFPSSISLLK